MLGTVPSPADPGVERMAYLQVGMWCCGRISFPQDTPCPPPQPSFVSGQAKEAPASGKWTHASPFRQCFSSHLDTEFDHSRKETVDHPESSACFYERVQFPSRVWNELCGYRDTNAQEP